MKKVTNKIINFDFFLTKNIVANRLMETFDQSKYQAL